MATRQVYGRSLSAALMGLLVFTLSPSIASAQPAPTVDPASPVAAPPPPGPVGPAASAPDPAPAPLGADAAPAPADGGPAIAACSQFGAALDHAAAYYSDFADAIAGDKWTYGDANVVNTNGDARTALRQSAAAAMDAAATPGLAPEIAAPMRSWSLGASKLLVIMGLHGSGDRMNSNAAELNARAESAQMACAHAGTHA